MNARQLLPNWKLQPDGLVGRAALPLAPPNSPSSRTSNSCQTTSLDVSLSRKLTDEAIAYAQASQQNARIAIRKRERMCDPDELKRLTNVFRELGAQYPEEWALSQLEEGIPQLARFLFLRQAWRCVVSEDDGTWIERAIAEAQSSPDAPYAGAGHALKALRNRGATNDEIGALVRAMQAELLFRIADLLDDPGEIEPIAGGVAWGLFEVDEDEQPVAPMDMLHESVLETDPTGREVRPRKEGGEKN